MYITVSYTHLDVYKRQHKYIVDRGYDIKIETKKIEEFYMSKLINRRDR